MSRLTIREKHFLPNLTNFQVLQTLIYQHRKFEIDSEQSKIFLKNCFFDNKKSTLNCVLFSLYFSKVRSELQCEKLYKQIITKNFHSVNYFLFFLFLIPKADNKLTVENIGIAVVDGNSSFLVISLLLFSFKLASFLSSTTGCLSSFTFS